MRVAAIGWVLALLIASQAAAHHSSAMFDRSRTLTLKGTIKEYQFVAPHSWISIIVPGEGGAEVRWDVEGATASRMASQGITPAKLKVGDKVTIRAHPLRDGRTGAALIDITFEDGTVFTNNTTKLPVGQ